MRINENQLLDDIHETEVNSSVSLSVPSKTTKTLVNFFFGDFREFVCGCGAALINITITYPINKVIFRQMLHNVGVNNALQQLSHEGVGYLYRGILPPLCQKCVSTALMFGIYETCRKPLIEMHFSPVMTSTVAGVIAGTTEALLTPFERIQTLLQDRSYHDTLKNTNHTVRVIWYEYGYREYYRGLVPILLRNGPCNALFFLLRDEAKVRLPEPKTIIGKTAKEFSIGAVIGAFGSTLFYPMNVIKVHMQSRLGGPYQSVWSASRQIYLERGRSIRSFYRGIHMNYTRSFISWGIINVAYEGLKKVLY